MRLLSLFGILISYVTIITCATYNGNSNVHYAIDDFELVTGIARNFSRNFFQKLTLLDIHSRVYSPVSVFIPMSMLMYGARGPTRQNYIKVLGLRENETNIARHGYERLIDTLSEYNLRIATKVYYPPDLMPNIFYIRFAMKVFNAELEPVDAISQHVHNKKVNEWLSIHTDHQCTKLFEEPLQAGPDSGILIVTAVYFKGAWESPFDRSLTFNRPFYSFRKVFDVPTMYKFDRLPYGRIDSIGASFVELPYKSAGSGDAMSMFVLLPDHDRHLNTLVWKLRYFDSKDLLTGVPTDVHLYLPKFKLESSVKLGRLFTYILGPENPFNMLVNFSGLSMSHNLTAFGDSIAKYVIEVDEDGDTAAGSSGTYFKYKSHQRLRRRSLFENVTQATEFNVNRPFVAIIATKGKIVLDIFTINFTGRALRSSPSTCVFLPCRPPWPFRGYSRTSANGHCGSTNRTCSPLSKRSKSAGISWLAHAYMDRRSRCRDEFTAIHASRINMYEPFFLPCPLAPLLLILHSLWSHPYAEIIRYRRFFFQSPHAPSLPFPTYVFSHRSSVSFSFFFFILFPG